MSAAEFEDLNLDTRPEAEQTPAPAARRRRAKAEPESSQPESGAPAQADPRAEALAAIARAEDRVQALAAELNQARVDEAEARRALHAIDFPPIPEGAEPTFHELRQRSVAISKLQAQTGERRTLRRGRRPTSSPQLWRGKA